MGALEVALGEPQARAGVAQRRSPTPRAPGRRPAAARAAASWASSNAPRSASAQISTSAAPPVNTLVSRRRGRARAGRGSRPRHAPGAQRMIGRVPLGGDRSRSEPRASATSRMSGDRRAGLRIVGQRRARGRRARRRAPVRLAPAAGRRRARRRPVAAHARRRRRPRSTPTQARWARTAHSEQRVHGRAGARSPARRRARSAWRSGKISSASSDAASTARRTSGSVSLASSSSNRLRQPVVAGVHEVQRGEPGQDVDPALAVGDLAQRLAQAPARVRQAGVERDGAEAGEQLAAVVAGRALLQRPLQVRRRRPRHPAARRVGRRPQQQLADLGVGLRAALEQVAGDDAAARRRSPSARAPPRRCSRSRSVRGRSSAIATAIRPWAKRAPAASARASRRTARDRSAPASSRPAPAALARRAVADRHAGDRDTCGGAPSPITASAATTPRSRGASAARRRRTTVRAIAVTCGASCSESSSASGPWAAIWRPSSPSSHGLPPTAR